MEPANVTFRRLLPADIRTLKEVGVELLDESIPEDRIPLSEVLKVLFIASRSRAEVERAAAAGPDAFESEVAEFFGNFSHAECIALGKRFCRSWAQITPQPEPIPRRCSVPNIGVGLHRPPVSRRADSRSRWRPYR
jgi:hypothetical protein